LVAFLLFVIVFIVSCSVDNPKTSNPESAPLAEQGRAESRGLAASSVIGYEGAGIRRSVENALNQHAARNAETKKAIDQASEQ
jgi:hypothetical protein